MITGDGIIRDFHFFFFFFGKSELQSFYILFLNLEKLKKRF